VTVRLPRGAGYAAITEAGLRAYAGMALQSDGRRGFKEVLGHAVPPSYPFRLRYEADVERMAKPAAIRGTITTPWRVILAGPDLHTLVVSDLVHNLAPAPDPALFPHGVRTDWIKEGRAVWKYLDGGENTLAEMKEFSRLAGELGFEHHVVEGFWRKWTPEQLRELVEYSRERGVGVWLWQHSNLLLDAGSVRTFFEMCRQAGVVGAKVDFFDHEAKDVVERYELVLREAARNRVLVNFHGANKPTGEARTWPNEMTREGIYGLENRRTEAWAAHNATLPFTRFLAGHADYTPVIFGERRKETSWAHQIATAAIFTSPVLVYGAHPASLLANPAVDVIRSLPATWDETRVLPMSAIGELAVFARRRGTTWFVAVVNGPDGRTIGLPLSFLGHGSYQATLVHDVIDDGAAVRVEREQRASRDTILEIAVRPGGGFIGRFEQRPPPASR
jgi:alpha-glucosidase